MPKQISCSTSVEKLINEAKELQQGSSGIGDDDARLTIAQRYGFVSWRQMEVYLCAVSGEPQIDSDFLQCACLCYLNSFSDFDKARTMLHNDPSLANRDIFHASCVGNLAAVQEFLSADTSLVNQRGGFYGWEPLMYACYSRLDLPGNSTPDVVECLLNHGANPNAYFMWGGQCKFTALTGVFGEGEDGPGNCPEHSDCERVARMLLTAGADPNDGQALYNRMFTPGHRCLSLLIEFGLNSTHKCNWLVERDGQLVEHPEQTLRYQLNWAIKNNHHDRAKLLIDRGADLTTANGGTPLYESALLSGDEALADYLVSNGAAKTELDSISRFAAACMSGNESLAEEMLADDPSLMNLLQTARPEFVNLAAAGNHLDAIRIIAKLGGDLNNRSSVGPMHEAAWAGNLDAVKLLVDLGADVTARDTYHFATPLQWALHHGGRQSVVDFLSTCEIDIFDAIACNNLDRIRAILKDDKSRLEATLGETRNATEGTNDWQTPLATAVMRNQTECVRVLLEYGANRSITDNAGRDLLTIARDCGEPDIVSTLETE